MGSRFPTSPFFPSLFSESLGISQRRKKFLTGDLFFLFFFFLHFLPFPPNALSKQIPLFPPLFTSFFSLCPTCSFGTSHTRGSTQVFLFPPPPLFSRLFFVVGSNMSKDHVFSDHFSPPFFLSFFFPSLENRFRQRPPFFPRAKKCRFPLFHLLFIVPRFHGERRVLTVSPFFSFSFSFFLFPFQSLFFVLFYQMRRMSKYRLRLSSCFFPFGVTSERRKGKRIDGTYLFFFPDPLFLPRWRGEKDKTSFPLSSFPFFPFFFECCLMKEELFLNLPPLFSLRSLLQT